MAESSFGILKTEMFYGFEKNFKPLDQLEQAIIDYIFTTIINALKQN